MDDEPCKYVSVRNLKPGDVLVFFGARHTVKYCGPSLIDPVYLIGFEEIDIPTIAKSPIDQMLVLDKGD